MCYLSNSSNDTSLMSYLACCWFERFDMHIVLCFVDYFLELTWDCREGFNMCYLCKSNLGCNGQDLKGPGFNPSPNVQIFETKVLGNYLLLVQFFAHVQVVCKFLLLASWCWKDHHILYIDVEMLAIAHT